MTDPSRSKAHKGPLKAYLPADERVLLSCKPSPLFIVLVPLKMLVVLTIAWVAGAWGASLLRAADNDVLHQFAPAPKWLALLFGGAIALRFFWQGLEWLARLYVMTDRRVLRVGGVLRQRVVDVPLARVQNITVNRSIRERVFGLGTLGFAAAGTAWTEIVWVMIPHPHAALARARDAIAGRSSDTRPTRPIIIGLAGGVASGKSAVAAELAALGCTVCDSDADARRALDRPDVRSQIMQWWGGETFDDQGHADRTKIAAIVFKDPAQRTRLERLVHPIVHAERAKQIEQAARRGAPAVVIDAPLLFEAGVDRECDAVVFVDTPREVRLARAVDARGWDEHEFDRREQAQMPVEEKRAKARFAIVNTRDRAELARRVADLLRQILETLGPGGTYKVQQDDGR